MEKDRNGILLESGTNEIEIMVFTIDDNVYGINVAKVREIMMSEPVKPMPLVHRAVEGIFKPRDTVLTVVDLPLYLRGAPGEKHDKDIFIVTNFNKMFIAFRVHAVVGISRISWSSIQKPDSAISGGRDSVATGIAQCNGELVTILDFEKIVTEIAPETGIQVSEVDNMGYRECRDDPILVAEDSILLGKLIEEALKKSGYVNSKVFPNGSELWDYLCRFEKEGDVSRHAALIITDIEMPQMDGHRLTKLIKSHDAFKKIPVIIFSSLITEEMRVKGKELGADEQLSKPEIGHLISIMDHLLDKR